MTTLLILQISGAVFTAGGLVHKVIKGNKAQPPPVTQGRLSVLKQLDWFFIIGGLLTTIVSLIIQSDNSQKAAVRAQNQASNQIQLLKGTLTGVYRIITRFDDLSFSVTYELPKSNYFAPVFGKMFETSPLRGLPLPLPKEPSTDTPDVHSSSVIGVYLRNNNPVAISWSESDIQFPLPDKSYLFVNPHSTNRQAILQAINFFCNPQLSLLIRSRKHHSEYFNVEGTNLLRSANLIYLPNSQEVFIRWVFDCPKKYWKQTKGMSSLPDFANATMTQSLLTGVPEWLMAMAPVSAKLTLDRSEICIDRFYRYDGAPPPAGLRIILEEPAKGDAPEKNNEFVQSATLPEDVIFNSKNLTDTTKQAEKLKARSSDGGNHKFYSKLPDDSELLDY